MKIDSKNKTILIFSDVHQDIYRVNKLLEEETYDVAICLGDWFDSFDYDSEYDIIKTCKFLNKWIKNDKFFTLYGNHDLHYFFNNKYTICSGYEEHKDVLIGNTFGRDFLDIRNKFLWYVWIDDYLCSHAGVNIHHFLPTLDITDKNALTTWLDAQGDAANTALSGGLSHWFFRAGMARGGRQNVGGIVWQDFDCEFEPIDGLKQIVGHTPHDKVLTHTSDGIMDYTLSDNLDIDCHLNQYLLIKDGKITIKYLRDL